MSGWSCKLGEGAGDRYPFVTMIDEKSEPYGARSIMQRMDDSTSHISRRL